MIQKTITLYTVEELKEANPEGYAKAHAKYKEGNDYMFMEDCLSERLHELLDEKGIVDTNDTSKSGTKPTRVMYSLGYCQGDGAMFEGDFIFTHKGKKYVITVKHSGHYYHSNSKDFYTHDEEGEEVDEWEEVEHSFNVEYKEVCKELEIYGYDFMEYEDSEENFIEMCEANEYTFTLDGRMENA